MAAKGIFKGMKGKGRVSELRRHRLVVFQAAFDDYMAGKCPASYVEYRANLMLKIGLPKEGR